MNISAIIKFLDNYLFKSGRKSTNPVEGNALLDKAGLLGDSKDRPGLSLRKLLRKGLLPHAYQLGGKGSNWVIPRSNSDTPVVSNYPSIPISNAKIKLIKEKGDSISIDSIIKQLEEARKKYKPDVVSYLHIAEAPPDSLERFFYYEDVREHDHLFLGVAQALYPPHKELYLRSGRDPQLKIQILNRLQSDGFYLLDLSELPMSLLNGGLSPQVQGLLARIENVKDSKTRIILIKATVYDAAFYAIK